jgi:hypothetical protein
MAYSVVPTGMYLLVQYSFPKVWWAKRESVAQQCVKQWDPLNPFQDAMDKANTTLVATHKGEQAVLLLIVSSFPSSATNRLNVSLGSTKCLSRACVHTHQSLARSQCPASSLCHPLLTVVTIRPAQIFYRFFVRCRGDKKGHQLVQQANQDVEATVTDVKDLVKAATENAEVTGRMEETIPQVQEQEAVRKIAALRMTLLRHNNSQSRALSGKTGMLSLCFL